LLFVTGVRELDVWGPDSMGAGRGAVRIIRRYLNQGPAALSACATELIKAGYKENAKL